MLKFLKSVVITGVLLLTSKSVFAQSWEKSPGWIRYFGGDSSDWGNWVEVTTDSGFIICGTTILKTTGPFDIGKMGYIVKTDSVGNVNWIRSYDSYTGAEPETPICRFHCIQQTSDRGYVVFGEGRVEGYSGEFLWLVKIDSLGVTQWSKAWGDDENSDGNFVRQTPDSGYILAGSTRAFGPAGTSLWLLKTDSLGDTLWTFLYGEEGHNYRAFCVNLTSDGNYIVTGEDDSSRELLLLKMDNNGNVMWERNYSLGGSRSFYVEETPDGGFIATGTCMDASAAFLLKTDEDGDSVWSRSYAGGDQCGGYCVHHTPDGGYVVAGVRESYGSFNSLAWFLKTDSLGDTLWTRTFGDTRWENDFRCVQLDPQGGYVMTGSTGDYRVNKIYEPGDIWLVKTDSLGYVPIAEDQIEVETSVDTSAPLGKPVEIRYTNMPGGFHAWVFDVTGRKVSEIHNANASGTITWGEGQNPGVYFIKSLAGNAPATKVIITR